MAFWRKRKIQEEEISPPGDVDDTHESLTDAAIETEPDLHEELEETGAEILHEAVETPVPVHTPLSDAREQEEEKQRFEEEQKGGWFSRLSGGLSKSSRKIGQGLRDVITKRKLDGEALEQLEDLLISADLGPRTAAKVVEDFSRERFGKEIGEDEIREALAESIAKILEPVAGELQMKKPEDGKPFVVLVCGVNGVGKTTTIGKLANSLSRQNKIILAAGDTFRAAAVEQLQIWSDRVKCPLVKKDVGADSASVAYESYEKSVSEKADILMIDTAGRLHNKADLMAELQKIVRVLKKRDENAPHEVLLVLDATTGQNAHSQVEIYKEMVNVTGLVVTKLDGSAKGGVVVSLADHFGLPIYAVGVGESLEDLQPFRPQDYARALVGL
jgi:fused signal recognition particle receptor